MYLNCHTYFSLKYGTLPIEALFGEARRCGVSKLALTDINNTSGYIEMLRIIEENSGEYPLEIALGIEFRRDNRLLYIGIAKNNDGFEELNRFLSHHNMNDIPLPDRPPRFSHVFVIYPFGYIHHPMNLRDYEFVGIRASQLLKLITSPYRDALYKLVIHHPVTYRNKTGYQVHRLLRAIDQNTLLSKLDPRVQAGTDEYMLPEPQLERLFRDYPQIIRNTRRLLEQCSISFELGTDKNKKSFTGSLMEDHFLLESLALEGFASRFSHYTDQKEVRQRLYRELEIIAQRSFEAYFLIAHDIIRFAHSKSFEHVGRGSGANSMVAYCLGITDVDPIELDLYFERFLNPERSSPPDFDIDFSWKDRDEVTQYIFDRHTYEHTCLLGTHTTFKDRSVLRELGKVFGLPKSEIDSMVTYPEQARNRDHITKLIFRCADNIYQIPSHLSIHAGGVLITERPIYAFTTTDLPPKGFPVSHFEMHNAEDIGIFKFDILSQRGLGHIKDSVEIIKRNRGHRVDIKAFDTMKTDPRIRELLSRGKTMGCFYVESPAMRMLLGKLRCDNYRTLVAASSIIRPGVARSGMMRAYIERHHSNGNYESIHPKMDELMKETYGVMVYQEDVIKVAHRFAGLTLAEADILRRGMSGKFRSRKEFQRVRDQFFRNCHEKAYPEHVIERVWYEIESFSGYSFSKGHSASYAVESYQSLFLKAHYPLEFMVGVINNFGGFYRTEFYFHEARMDGASIEAPCINHSEYTTTIYDKSIYMGFIHLKSLEVKNAKFLAEERARNGPFRSLDNFMRRVPLSLEQLRILVRIGAFRFTGKSKRELLWDAYMYYGTTKTLNKDYKIARQAPDLFEEEPTRFELPPLDFDPFEDAFDEFELLGFPLCDPFIMLKTDNRGDTRARELMRKLKSNVEMVGYMVTTKNTKTKDGKLMHFGTFYDDKGEVFDTTHFPPVARKYPFRGRGFYHLRGKVVEDFGYPMVEIGWMEKLPMVSREERIEEMK